jgi:hypothetical protein
MQIHCVFPNSHKEKEYGSFEMRPKQLINETHDHVKLHKQRRETNIV